ncbi:Fur family transcriptional regulator [uncultured Oscillibacter sp.]|uniref:Fur family transcriptional regulator n=1 Tax=uncultured Oscillibacter sp. TaxID=876091 RepID=UPI0025D29CA3|nr:transcriptional repressor [uncultured Oscillibacter sp.]
MPYTTKQSQAILQALERRGERPADARSLADDLRDEGVPVGLATVYRQLERLAEAGLVHRIVTDTGALYQYCSRQAAGEVCFLLRCQSCGRMEHLDCPQLQALYRHIAAEHGFRVDPRRTVLTGLCGPCAGQEAGHGEG